MTGKAFLNKQSERPIGDLYETPYSMTEQLLERETFDGAVFEPASGKGAIVNVLDRRGYMPIYSDLYYTKNKVDFLKTTYSMQNIITNPPYSMADEFVTHAKKLYKNKIAFLLRTNYLSGTKRLNAGIYTELSKVYIFSRMADLRAPMRGDGKYPTAGIVYAWCIWEKGYTGDPMINFIDNNKYCLSIKEWDKEYAIALRDKGIITTVKLIKVLKGM